MKRQSGKYLAISTVGEKVKAFIPNPLPPNPPIEWSFSLREKFDEALIALGRLDSVSNLLPDTTLFLYMYIRKEAVLSSMIEGTQSSLSDLLLFELGETPGVPLDDVREVSNYVAALKYGMSRLDKGFPLSLRLIKEIHEILLRKGRGSSKSPGEFRKSQNWIGGTRPGNAVFVPPPPDRMIECMNDLELFLHNQPQATPVLLKAALAHVQFETIHPFLDGNGRLGRLLITLLLYDQKVLRDPILYLSLYFKTHRQYYYELLNDVRVNGNWEAWLEFFAEAIQETASQAVSSAKELLKIINLDNEQIGGLGRPSESCLKIHKALIERPIAASNGLVKKTGLTAATVNKGLGHLVNLGIINELTARKRNRLFVYSKYIEILNEGTEVALID
ncbi:MAG: cell filamentation protein Fic [Bdellovibrionales bacterium GWA2_49_15]|nr:MAG: cell filamentation protein Fic [Bdellovibrionales bacterium GWA2_49_15]HAZ14504.1 cell filamentation protein Fic [Bdellovibrionales bacterium]